MVLFLLVQLATKVKCSFKNKENLSANARINPKLLNGF